MNFGAEFPISVSYAQLPYLPLNLLFKYIFTPREDFFVMLSNTFAFGTRSNSKRDKNISKYGSETDRKIF